MLYLNLHWMIEEYMKCVARTVGEEILSIGSHYFATLFQLYPKNINLMTPTGILLCLPSLHVKFSMTSYDFL